MCSCDNPSKYYPPQNINSFECKIYIEYRLDLARYPIVDNGNAAYKITAYLQNLQKEEIDIEYSYIP